MEQIEKIGSWVDFVINIWQNKHINIEAGASQEKLTEAEIRTGIKFPPSMAELYKRANGFKDWDYNEDMFSIWPLERIIEEYESSSDQSFVGFCDYLINSHSIGFAKGKIGIFKSYDEFNPIASSFEQAIDLINSNSELIY